MYIFCFELLDSPGMIIFNEKTRIYGRGNRCKTLVGEGEISIVLEGKYNFKKTEHVENIMFYIMYPCPHPFRL